MREAEPARWDLGLSGWLVRSVTSGQTARWDLEAAAASCGPARGHEAIARWCVVASRHQRDGVEDEHDDDSKQEPEQER